jgi:hypothetical protein
MLNLLSAQNMAMIVIIRADGRPGATPIRNYSLGMEITNTS